MMLCSSSLLWREAANHVDHQVSNDNDSLLNLDFFIAHIEESNVFFGELFKLNLLYILLNY